MTLSSIEVNGSSFPVFSLHDVAMREEAQKAHGVNVKAWRVETYLPVGQDRPFTSGLYMITFISAESFEPNDRISAPIVLCERKIDTIKLLEAYRYQGMQYSEQPFFSLRLNGFLGCTMFLNLCFYLLETGMGIIARSMHTIYFVDKSYLDNGEDDNEPQDTSTEEFFQSNSRANFFIPI